MRSIVCVFSIITYWSAMGAITSPEERGEQLGQIRALVEREVRIIESSEAADLKNPFIKGLSQLVMQKVEDEVQETVRSPKDVLDDLSQFVNPTGIFAINGEYYLIFKEKRLKAGSPMKVNFDGQEYTMILSKVTGKAYTLTMGETSIEYKLK